PRVPTYQTHAMSDNQQSLQTSLLAPPTTGNHTPPLHDALPICNESRRKRWKPYHATHEKKSRPAGNSKRRLARYRTPSRIPAPIDRKSTRLNSSHVTKSYAVFCFKTTKKK